MTPETRKFRVSTSLKDYIGRILERRDIPYTLTCESEQWWCEVSLTGNRFHEVVKRAEAEMKSERDKVLYVTHKESKNKSLQKALEQKFGLNSFFVMNKTN